MIRAENMLMDRQSRNRRPSLESLESRLSQSGLMLSDPLPNPEPPPGPDLGDNPPIIYPILPTSGPSGPGS
jgi:hypothetical protein